MLSVSASFYTCSLRINDRNAISFTLLSVHQLSTSQSPSLLHWDAATKEQRFYPVFRTVKVLQASGLWAQSQT